MFLPDLNDWQVEVLRFTAFSTTSIDIDPSELWGTLAVGGDLKEVNQRPQTKETLVSGDFLAGVAELKIQGNRIDWILHPSMQPEEILMQHEGIPLLDKYRNLKSEFTTPVLNWLKNFGFDFNRIAFGAVLLQKAPDASGAYQELEKILPEVKFQQEWRDFTIQINSPVDFDYGGEKLKINRVKRNAVLKAQVAGSANGVDANFESFYCRMELDINSEAERRIPLGSNVALVLNEILSKV